MTNTVGSRETLPQACPALTDEQIDRLRPLGRVRHVRTGDVLFQPGDLAVPFFVLLSGRMEIVQPTFDGERTIARHEPRDFTGEMTRISGWGCLREIAPRYRRVSVESLSLVLVASGENLLPEFEPALGQYTVLKLREAGSTCACTQG